MLEGFVGTTARKIPTDLSQLRRNTYVYLGTFNVLTEKLSLLQLNKASRVKVYSDIGPYTVRRDMVYDNGGARVYE
jgi:uncharacterized membrane protein